MVHWLHHARIELHGHARTLEGKEREGEGEGRERKNLEGRNIWGEKYLEKSGGKLDDDMSRIGCITRASRCTGMRVRVMMRREEVEGQN